MREKKTLEFIVTKNDNMISLIRQPYAATIGSYRLNVQQMDILTKITETLQSQMKHVSNVDDTNIEKENRIFNLYHIL